MAKCCVTSWVEIRMVHRSMRNGSRVADELYIKRVLLALEDFLFFSLYSFSCIAKQVTTLKQFRLLSCPDFTRNEPRAFCPAFDKTLLLPISLTPDPACYSGKVSAPVVCLTIAHSNSCFSCKVSIFSPSQKLFSIFITSCC